MPKEKQIEELNARLNDLLVKYCQNAQYLLPSLSKLAGVREEMEMVLKKLKELGHPKTDIDKIAKQLGIDIDDVKKKYVLKG